MNRLLYHASFIFLMIMNFSCQDNQKNKSGNATDSTTAKNKNISIPGSFSSQTLLRFDSNSVNLFLKKYPRFNNFQNDIKKFYSTRQYTYAWYDTSGMIEQADNLYNQVINIGQEGISDKTLLYNDSLAAMFTDSAMQITPEKELMLTAQYFNYAEKVWGG